MEYYATIKQRRPPCSGRKGPGRHAVNCKKTKVQYTTFSVKRKEERKMYIPRYLYLHKEILETHT